MFSQQPRSTDTAGAPIRLLRPPMVNCQQVQALVQHTRLLPADEQTQLLNDLERDPDVGPVVVAEVRSHLPLPGAG
jgi:hypothetical protein